MAGLFVGYSDCRPEVDDEFNRGYDEIHVPDVLEVGPITVEELSPKRFASTG